MSTSRTSTLLSVRRVWLGVSVAHPLTPVPPATGYIIGMCELDVHRHADDEGFHRQLVIRFAKLCWTMHSYFFFPERNPTRGRRPQHLPSKAFVIFGPVSRMEVVHLEFWDGDHFCSLSTSVPGVDERDERRARVDFVGLKEQVRQIRLNDMLINVPELHTHLAETDIGYPFPPGNCAEAIPQARCVCVRPGPLHSLIITELPSSPPPLWRHTGYSARGAPR